MRIKKYVYINNIKYPINTYKEECEVNKLMLSKKLDELTVYTHNGIPTNEVFFSADNN